MIVKVNAPVWAVAVVATVNVEEPDPLIAAGLNVAPSELPARGSVVIIFPSVALRITMVGAAGLAGGIPELRHAANSM